MDPAICKERSLKEWIGVIECQKRGLPHIHILRILPEEDNMDVTFMTVTAMDVVYDLNRQGHTLYGFGG